MFELMTDTWAHTTRCCRRRPFGSAMMIVGVSSMIWMAFDMMKAGDFGGEIVGPLLLANVFVGVYRMVSHYGRADLDVGE